MMIISPLLFSHCRQLPIDYAILILLLLPLFRLLIFSYFDVFHITLRCRYHFDYFLFRCLIDFSITPIIEFRPFSRHAARLAHHVRRYFS
jgi:hypothetical protein